jgi:hypothetical protein
MNLSLTIFGSVREYFFVSRRLVVGGYTFAWILPFSVVCWGLV